MIDDDNDGAVTTIFGWCQTHGKPDQYHALCRKTYRTTFGVEHRCGCPAHDNDNKETTSG